MNEKKYIVTAGPSADMMLACLEEKTDNRAAFISDLRFPDGYQLKIIAEFESISRDKTEAESYQFTLKHVRPVGRDATPDNVRITPHELTVPHYSSNIRSGEAYAGLLDELLDLEIRA